MFILLMLLSSQVFACEKLGKITPALTKKLKEYDQFVVSLQNSKTPEKEINKRIRSQGILLDAYINEKLAKNYTSAFIDDSISGAYTLFLKNTKLPPGLSNDIIYEVAKSDSAKSIRHWQIPANQSFLGIMGNEIIHRTYLGSPCASIRRDVLLAISPNGKFRAIPDTKIPEMKYIQCPAAKVIFKDSDGSCAELIDAKSKKKRIIVFQSPMT